MIKKMKYGNIENVNVVNFGFGTISINSGIGETHKSILMKTNDKMPIGNTGIKYESSDDFNPEIVIAFHNKESFDVFFDIVMEVKNSFEVNG